MPIAAIVTTRELKNTETGLDLSVPQTEEIAGTLGSTTLYQTIVITNLAIFKSPKHKEDDVVQFMCSHKYAEFEALHKSLDEKFSGTALPILPSRMVLRSSAAVVKERRNACDTFLRFIARTPKMATSPELLEFLGVSKSKASYFSRQPEESSEAPDEKDKPSKEEPDSTDHDTTKPNNTQKSNTKKVDPFGGVVGADDPDVDLFGQTTDTAVDEELFAAAPVRSEGITRSQGVKLFGEDNDDQELFIPEGARIQSKQEASLEVEDNSDLLTIEDDLDKLLNVSKEKPKQKPMPKPRPVPAPRASRKPPTAPKPSMKKTDQALDDLFGGDTKAVDTMGDDDIMMYIESESNQKEDDLSLF